MVTRKLSGRNNAALSGESPGFAGGNLLGDEKWDTR